MRRNVREKTGSMEQLAYIRPIVMTDGKAAGLNAYIVNNGKISFTVLKDRCLDIGELKAFGDNVSFISKTGMLAGDMSHIGGAVRHTADLMCGFLFTCGLDNVGAACSEKGLAYPAHGRIRSSKASNVRITQQWQGDDYVLVIEGEVRQSSLAQENLLLRRRLSTSLFSNKLLLEDTVTNEGFVPEPVFLMYHINFGWPLLDERTKISIPADSAEIVIGENDENEDPRRFGPPMPGAGEKVFKIDAREDEEGYVACTVLNPDTKRSAAIKYLKAQLPKLGEWKLCASGDYVLGIEPGICGTEGRKALIESGEAHMLLPDKSLSAKIAFEFK